MIQDDTGPHISTESHKELGISQFLREIHTYWAAYAAKKEDNLKIGNDLKNEDESKNVNVCGGGTHHGAGNYTAWPLVLLPSTHAPTKKISTLVLFWQRTTDDDNLIIDDNIPGVISTNDNCYDNISGKLFTSMLLTDVIL